MAHSETIKTEFKISEISQEIIKDYDINGPSNTLLKIRAKQQQTNIIVNFANLKRKTLKLNTSATETQCQTKIYLTTEDTDFDMLCNALPEGVTICAHELAQDAKTKKEVHQFLFINRVEDEAELFFIECGEFTPQKNIIDFSKKKLNLRKNKYKIEIIEPKTTTLDSALWIALSIEHIKASSLIEKLTVSI